MNPDRTATPAAWRSVSAEATVSRGEAFAPALRAGDVVSLVGPLGAGKTRLVSGMARGLAAAARVRSPSFAIVHEYRGRLPLFHLDLYRLSESEVPDLGLEEMTERGALVVEWGNQLPPPYSLEALTLTFTFLDGDERDIAASARAGRGLELLAAWQGIP